MMAPALGCAHEICTWPYTTYKCLGVLQFTWPAPIQATILGEE